ncbi:type I-E CRISPR-associated protein Cas7/Cse4/CasC [Couchioplanes caeruleus]|uniref:Type I-E CRISPR-associated protein Cas7/Cse4/CasC n=2 Tax=Couchioplanes caeruleus TaxID=56438 RepID=A0A1K0GM54_9ACTN|nr:type I-E CRISPR-associated protein Cas7/Cse4/CasC [Couchioplanes caeruleus]OJF12140.1 type I-E CRISPR-associated protein Cas7/Cse4/CasC [Couchioplanes caeruleus subsp. caeruleus]ROP28985.1 CRISPR system Cascade subunit CasC [Couchioplanes caeruleus]
MTRSIIDVHILQTVPPSNLNRDDSGSPKTAVYGGVRRARVSSQAWKRAVRLAFEEYLDDADLGERTKRVGEAIAARISGLDPALDSRAAALAVSVLKAAGLLKKEPRKDKPAETDYLLFLSHRQQQRLAELAVRSAHDDTTIDARTAKEAANTAHSIDIAMFGRMVADVSDINVDAAVQVAHAISVHHVENEFDYFTAVDDRKYDLQESGAGMIGTVEFNSSTLYRYATIDVDRLHDTLGDPAATRRAVEAFLRAYALSMPTGKRNTFANGTRPDAIVVHLRDTRAINLVGAFEEPVGRADDTRGRVAQAARTLAAYTAEVHDAYGERPAATWITHVGDRTGALAALGTVLPLNELTEAVGATIAGRIGPGR